MEETARTAAVMIPMTQVTLQEQRDYLTQKQLAEVLAGVVAGPAPRGILVAVEQGVPAAAPLVAEQTADASILLAEPVTVTVVVVVVVVVVFEVCNCN